MLGIMGAEVAAVMVDVVAEAEDADAVALEDAAAVYDNVCDV